MSLLTAEIIRQQEALKELPDEQVEVITSLANNAFKKEIDDATGVWHRRLEEDIKSLTGKEKPQGLKSYDWLKSEWQAMQEETEKKLKEAVNQAKSAKPDSKEAEELRKQIADYENLVNEWKNKYSTEKEQLEQKLTEAQKGNLLLEVGFEKAQSLMGVEFDPLLPEDVRNTFIDSKWREVLNSYTPEKTVNDKGQEVTQWRDKDGKLLRNEQNGMALMTTKDLLMKELKPIVKAGRNQAGTGTKTGVPGQAAQMDLRGAKTQVEADDIIASQLLAKGLQRGTPQFAQEHQKIRTENKVNELPLSRIE